MEIPDHIDALRRQGGLGAAMRMPGEEPGQHADVSYLLQFPLANLALCVLFARNAPTRKPLVAQLAAEVVGLRLRRAVIPAWTASSRRRPGCGLRYSRASFVSMSSCWLAGQSIAA
ncbi:MAG TPA: hypothetical protein VJ370_15940 [Streptosporangiaceae bacterium]|nr:hypothetical protein [Streptosporangiaceae bacterium]